MSVQGFSAPDFAGQASLKPKHFQCSPAAEAQAQLDAMMGAVIATRHYLDRVELFPRFDEKPPETLLRDLRQDAEQAFWLPDLLRDYAHTAARFGEDDCPPDLRRYRNFPHWLPQFRMVVVVVPREETHGRLARLPWKVNAVELAQDRIFPDAPEALHLRMDDFHVRYGMQPWRGKRHQGSFGASRYMGDHRQRGINLAGYADRYCKSTGEWPCSHLEVRLVGPRALSSKLVGIHSTADLAAFDDRHRAFWKTFERYSVVDIVALGRCADNVREDQRRQKPDIRNQAFGCKLAFDNDARLGNILWHSLAAHPTLDIPTTQSFVDALRDEACHSSLFVRNLRAKNEGWLIPLTLYYW